MKRRMLIVVFALWAAGSVLVGCGGRLDAGHVGPVGPQGSVGPQGPVGPQPLEGTPPANLTVIENTDIIVTNEYALSGFSQIAVNGGFDVTIRQGDGFEVSAQFEDTALPYIQMDQEGDLLTIMLEPGRTYHMVNITLAVEITMPELTRLALEGGAEATVIGLNDFESEEDLLSELHRQ
jgi:hypothetical protein